MANPDVQGVIDDAVSALPPRLQTFRATVEDGIRSLVATGVRPAAHQRPVPPDHERRAHLRPRPAGQRPVRWSSRSARRRTSCRPRPGTASPARSSALLPDDVGVTLVTPADAPQVYNADRPAEVRLVVAGTAGAGDAGRCSRRLAAPARHAAGVGGHGHRRPPARPGHVAGDARTAGRPGQAGEPGRRGGDLRRPRRQPAVLDAVGARRDAAGPRAHPRLGPARHRGRGAPRGRVGAGAGCVVAGRRAAVAQTARRRGRGAGRAYRTPVADEPWTRRVAAGTRAFAEGLELPERAAQLGGYVRDHRNAARWTGIVGRGGGPAVLAGSHPVGAHLDRRLQSRSGARGAGVAAEPGSRSRRPRQPCRNRARARRGPGRQRKHRDRIARKHVGRCSRCRPAPRARRTARGRGWSGPCPGPARAGTARLARTHAGHDLHAERAHGPAGPARSRPGTAASSPTRSSAARRADCWAPDTRRPVPIRIRCVGRRSGPS